MLTGDNVATAKQISEELALKRILCATFATKQSGNIRRNIEKQNNNKVIFVGDGINDAPVLARADIGIAMGGIGSDAAIEAADVVIMNDDIGKIEDGIIISKNTNRIVNQNIVFALAVKSHCAYIGSIGYCYNVVSCIC